MSEVIYFNMFKFETSRGFMLYIDQTIFISPFFPSFPIYEITNSNFEQRLSAPEGPVMTT